MKGMMKKKQNAKALFSSSKAQIKKLLLREATCKQNPTKEKIKTDQIEYYCKLVDDCPRNGEPYRYKKNIRNHLVSTHVVTNREEQDKYITTSPTEMLSLFEKRSRIDLTLDGTLHQSLNDEQISLPNQLFRIILLPPYINSTLHIPAQISQLIFRTFIRSNKRC